MNPTRTDPDTPDTMPGVVVFVLCVALSLALLFAFITLARLKLESCLPP